MKTLRYLFALIVGVIAPFISELPAQQKNTPDSNALLLRPRVNYRGGGQDKVQDEDVLRVEDKDGNPVYRLQPDGTVIQNLNTIQRQQARANIAAISDDAPTFGALSDGISRDITIISDSTSNEAGEWGHLLAQKIAEKYKTHSVKVSFWNASNSAYDAPIAVQTGSSGERYIASTGGNGSAQFPVAYVPCPTTGIDVQVDLEPVSWNSGAIQTIFAQFGGAGARGMRFLITATGYLAVSYSPDGTNFPQVNCAVPTGFAAGSRHWVRVTFAPDNGASGNTATFYSSTDGTTWTMMGTPVVNSGATTLFSNTTINYELFARQTGVDPMAGKIYAVRMCDGVGGVNRLPPQIDLWQTTPNADNSIITLGGSPEITIMNAGIAGSSLTSWSDATLLSRTIINRDTTRILVSLGHNHGVTVNYGSTQTYSGLLNTFVTAVLTRAPSSELVFMSQNPRRTPAINIRAHAIRRDQLYGWCRTKGYRFIDVYRAFQESSVPLSSLLNVDGIHPNSDGSQIWATTVANALVF